MKVGWFVAMASVFYFFVVALFWPIERQIMPATTPSVDRDGYEQMVVEFSDNHVAVRVPTTIALQEKGLAGVAELPDDEGMLWFFSPAQRQVFWMKGMIMPLDIIWINSNHIVSITANAKPPVDPASSDLPLLDPGVPVDSVLEVAAGFAIRHSLQVGDVVSVDPAPQW
jgi:uncharacterized protein